MFNQKTFSKKFKRIFTWALIAVFVLISALLTIGRVSPSSYYLTQDYEATDYYNCLIYKVNLKNKQAVDSIWINLGSTDEGTQTIGGITSEKEDIRILVGRANSESDTFLKRTDGTVGSENSPFIVSNDAKGVKIGSWQLLYNYQTPTEDAYYVIATKNAIRINEIAFVGREKTANENEYKAGYILLDAVSVGSGLKGQYAGGTESWYTAINAANNTIDMSETGKAQGEKLLDEQNLFNPSKISNGEYKTNGRLTLKEGMVYNSCQNIFSYKYGEMDLSINPLGILIISVGTFVFGASAFALRIMPIILGCVSIALAYFIAKLFNKENLELLVSLIATVVLTVITAFDSFVFMPLITVLLGVIYFGLKYFLDDSVDEREALINLVIASVFFGLSLAINTVGIFVLPVLIFAFVYKTVVRAKKGAYSNGGEIAKSCVIAFLGFFAIPFVIVAFTYLTLTNGYVYLYDKQIDVLLNQFFKLF